MVHPVAEAELVEIEAAARKGARLRPETALRLVAEVRRVRALADRALALRAQPGRSAR